MFVGFILYITRLHVVTVKTILLFLTNIVQQLAISSYAKKVNPKIVSLSYELSTPQSTFRRLVLYK